MFRDPDTGARRNKCSGRRNIKGLRPITAGAARIEDVKNLAIPERLCLFTHDSRELDEFSRRFTLHPKCRQEAGNLRFGSIPSEDFFHRKPSFFRQQVLTFEQSLDESGDQAFLNS